MSSLVAAEPASGGSGTLLLLALPLLLAGFLIITTRRRSKAAQALQATLVVGDEIMTTAGLLGRITALDDKIATLEVSPGVRLRFDRRAIAGPAPATPTSSDSSADVSSEPTSPTE